MKKIYNVQFEIETKGLEDTEQVFIEDKIASILDEHLIDGKNVFDILNVRIREES